ncbi:hypothetical protein Tco_1397551 [Tanacetum coccineum]
MNAKRQVEFRIDLVHRATLVAKSPYHLAPSEMQELSGQLQELEDKGYHKLRVHEDVIPRTAFGTRYEHFEPMEEVHFLGHVERSKSKAVRNWMIILRSGSVVGDALGRNEKVKSRRVRGMILAAQSKAFKQENVLAERLHGLAPQMERKGDENAAESVRDVIGFEYCLASSNGWTKSPVLWAEIGEGSLIRPKLVQETTDEVVVIKEKLQATRDHQKSYADSGRKMIEYEGKLAPRYVGPFEILERIGPVAYRLRLLEELIGVHDTFHVSNLKKFLGNANLHVPLNEIKIDKTLRFVEEPVEIMDRGIKSLKRIRIPFMKVRCGPEFTWEREDYMKSKYPYLFVDHAV